MTLKPSLLDSWAIDYIYSESNKTVKIKKSLRSRPPMTLKPSLLDSLAMDYIYSRPRRHALCQNFDLPSDFGCFASTFYFQRNITRKCTRATLMYWTPKLCLYRMTLM